jgi:hypothetical protein
MIRETDLFGTELHLMGHYICIWTQKSVQVKSSEEIFTISFIKSLFQREYIPHVQE